MELEELLDTQLQHFGVKGMKWGKHKSYDSSEDKKTVNTKQEGFRLAKGSELHRTTSNENEPNSGHAYVSFKPKDIRAYAKMSKLDSAIGRKKTYDMTMKVTKDLVAPSKEERVSTFVQLVKENPKFSKEFEEAAKEYSPSYIKSRYDNLDSKSDADVKKMYETFAITLGGNPKLRDEYFNALQKKGYNMIVDDADAQIHDSPIIIFDRNNFEVNKVSEITKAYIKDLKSKPMPDITHSGGETMTNSDTQLEHFGVKGMKWGVRKSRTSKDRASETTPKPKSTLRKYIDSNKREIGMLNMVKDLDGLSDNEIRNRLNRVRNENDMKAILNNADRALPKRRKNLREEYFNRANLTDTQLQERVNRLKLEENLRKEVVRATRSQREAANKVIKKVSAQTVSYYTDPTTGEFSATGVPATDMLLKETLQYPKSNNVIPIK